MKNFMVANLSNIKRYNKEGILSLIHAQIENSLELGWDPEDIWLLANFDYEFMGIKTMRASLNKRCLTGSKIFGMKYLFKNNMVNDVVWAHDLDAWQNVEFDYPFFIDVGVAKYSNDKFNGGSMFWRREGEDIADKVVEEIQKKKEKKEEPTINRILKSKEYKHRVTIINRSFNVGCSGYVKRWQDSIKPLRVCHFHPYNRIAWETHALDRNGLDNKGISNRLEKLLRKYYPQLATELSEDGRIAQRDRRRKRILEAEQNKEQWENIY